MKKILWQTRSPVVYESFCKNELLKSANGGNTYDIQAIKALSKGFDISLDKNSVMNPGENVFSYLKKIKNSNIKDADVIIREPYPVVFGKKNTIAKSVAIIHHIDEMQNKNSLKHKWFFKQLKKHLRKTDLVITVSDYWKNYLTSEGCKNVKVIYNSFNPDEYNINEKDVVNFKSKYDFKNNVPIIYIGNAHRKKGVYEVYNALKNSSYQLVMTGAKNNATDLPIKFLNLDRQDYLCLLHASGLVITFSNMEEGWNRIAHEAMLSNWLRHRRYERTFR
jgi:hypothetical protein